MGKRTPLYDDHVALKGRIVDFAGWELPIQYSGLSAEHVAVRTAAGLFDVSHMGQFEFSGPGALDTVQYLTTNNARKLEDNQSQYSLLCYEHGGVVDDLILYRFAEDRYIMVVNAGNIDKDWEWVTSHTSKDVTLTNRSDDFAMFALQGPKAEGILQRLADADLSAIKPFRCVTTDVKGSGVCTIARTGYTGEDGFEIFVDPDKASVLWNAVLETGAPDGILPVGLGARDTLRLEAKFSLYGHEITADTNPLEAGLGWAVKLKNDDFIGRDALKTIKENGLTRSLIGFAMIDKGIPRDGYPLCDEEKTIGIVTSGTMSPSLQKAIGIGYVPVALKEIGTKIYVDIRGKKRLAEIVKTPFISKD
jgi:aminomethyltransferase